MNIISNASKFKQIFRDGLILEALQIDNRSACSSRQIQVLAVIVVADKRIISDIIPDLFTQSAAPDAVNDQDAVTRGRKIYD